MHYVIGWLIDYDNGDGDMLYLYGLTNIEDPFDSSCNKNIKRADKFDDFHTAKQWAVAFDEEDSRIGDPQGTIIVRVDGNSTMKVFSIKAGVILQDYNENIFTEDWV